MAPVCLRWIVALAALSAWAADAESVAGCFVTEMAYEDPIPGETFPLNASSVEACQELCAGQSNCTHFSYWPTNTDCWLFGEGNNTLRYTEQDVISGPAVCPEESPACTVVPADVFPSFVQQDWPTLGYQPQPLQCFPLDCGASEMLESNVAGWTGPCKNFVAADLGAGETCESRCSEDVNCPGYQVVNGSCILDIGWSCEAKDAWTADWQPVEAKRIMRGSVRVLKELVGLQVPALDMVFGQAEWENLGDMASKACADICYSILGCQFWQVYDARVSGTGESGCWVEQYGNVPYPLIGTDMLLGGQGWVAGEYIQRYCPEAPFSEDGGEPWFVWALIALAVIAFLTMVGFGVWAICCRPPTKPHVRRGLKAKAPPAEPQAQPLMYLYAVPPPVQTYAVPVAAPMMQTAPMYQTYQTAPMVQTSAIPMAMAAPAQAGSVVVPMAQGSVRVPMAGTMPAV